MEYAALAVSIVAVVVSALSVRYTRAAMRNDAARRFEERTPVVRGWLEPVNGGGTQWYRLWLELGQSEALTGLSIEMPPDCGVTFAGGQDGVTGEGSTLAAHWQTIGMGGKVAWRVRLEKGHSRQTIKANVACHRGDDVWAVLVDIDRPRTSTIAVY